MDEHKPRITSYMSGVDVVVALVDGNPGALNVCMQLVKEGPTVDPLNMMGPLSALFTLDLLGIYGSRIWVLYKNVCNQSAPKMLAMLRAVTLGILTKEALDAAITAGEDYNPPGFDVDATAALVKERLPDFML